jgi:hypothetical protein
VRAIFEGAPIALFRIEGQVLPYALLAQRTIKTIAELRGKTIMVGGEKDITRVYLERMLTPNGIKAGDLPRSSRRSAWLGRRCRWPKTCTGADIIE